ncbi:MAG: hypothetical protein ACYCU0_14465 [Solirubrobacteraceae bacterium]
MSAEQNDGTPVEALASENGAGPAAGKPAALTASAPPMRPEVAVGAAFAGGVVLALIVRRVRS